MAFRSNIYEENQLNAYRKAQEAQRQAEEEQRQAYERALQAQNAAAQAQNKQTNPLEAVLSGVINSAKNVGTSLMDLFGTGGAAFGDMIESIKTGKATSKNQDDYRKWLYGTDSVKDAAAKGLGTGIDAAATLTDFIPGLGTGAKVALNVGQGIASGAANPLIEYGTGASLEDILKGAAVGGAGAGVGQYVGGKLASKVPGTSRLSKIATSNLGRGALTGAASGAVAGGLSAGLNGGNVFEGALQGAGRGGLGGATMAGAMGVTGKALQKLNNRIMTPGATPDATQNVVNKATAQAMPAMEDTANNQSNLFGRALKNAGNDLQAAQTNITRAERRKFGIKDAGETVNQLRKRTGLSNIDDQADFAKNITGSDGSVMDDVLRYNISKDENGQPLTLRQDQYVKAINDAVGKEWKKSVMGETYEQFRANLIDDIQNQDPITAANWLKKAAATQRAVAEGKGPTSDKAAQKARIYTEVANNIDDLTYSTVPQNNVNRMFDDTIDEFNTRAKEAKAAGNKKYAAAYEKLAKELSDTERTIAAYRTFKKDFVKSSQLAEISRGAQSGSLEAGYKRGNVLGRVVNTLAEEPINRTLAYAGGKLSDIGDIVNGTSTTKLGQVAGKARNAARNAAGNAWNALNNETLSNKAFGGADLNLPTFGDIATRQTARQAALDQLRTQNTNREIQNAQMDMQNALQDYSNASNQVLQAQANTENARAQVGTGSGTGTMDTIAQAMDRALAVGDITSYSKLADLYKQAYNIYQLQNPTATSTNSTNNAKALNATQSKALSGLQQLQTLYNMQPGVRTALYNSPLSGLIDLTGGDEYTAQADSLATTLGYLLSGANIKDSEIAAVKRDYIPSTFDSPAVRQQKLSRAEQLLRNYLADTGSLANI